ncbi:hypothetical protein [Clostridium sp. HBUAS56017]|uniref:hypothetical protein n=1 Tax=Clostridium sp. HBUAS56017 TaxID=2571128 RepID=UPI0011789959|nr:hypothetical protein [Clostridium sp. HBUAS56017]
MNDEVNYEIGSCVTVTYRNFIKKHRVQGTIMSIEETYDEDWLGAPMYDTEIKVQLENNKIITIEKYSKYKLN